MSVDSPIDSDDEDSNFDMVSLMSESEDEEPNRWKPYESDSDDEEPNYIRGKPHKFDPVSGLQYGKDWSDSQKKSGAKSHYKFSIANSRELTDFEVPRDIVRAAEKMGSMDPKSHIAVVRRNLRHIRYWARKLRKKNQVSRSKLATHIQNVHAATSPDGIHIELLSKLLADSKFSEAEDLIRDMKRGFRLTGKIQTSKSAKIHPVRRRKFNKSKLRRHTQSLTRKIQKSILRAPSNPEQAKLEQSVYTQTLEDIRKKRMAPLSKIDGRAEFPPTKRFGILQSNSSGKEKIRIIDDFAESMINDSCQVNRRIRMGRISDLIGAVRKITNLNPGHSLHVLKSDAKSAYKNCPIFGEDLRLARVILKDIHSGEVVESKHYSCPFGAVGSVYAWDRLAEGLVHILSYFLAIPISRFVDDLFCAVYAEYSVEIRNAMLEICDLLGIVLDPEKSPDPAEAQVILGVLVRIKYQTRRDYTSCTVTTRLDPQKAVFWRGIINDIIDSGFIPTKTAEKLAGRLNFATAATVGGVGGARLRNIYSAVFQCDTRVNDSLLLELKWWAERLQSQTDSLFPCGPRPQKVCVLYTDAEGSGGVGAIFETAGKPALSFRARMDIHKLPFLVDRKTQIIPLESLVVLASVKLWRSELAGARLLLFIDNQSSLGALKKGRSRAPDLSRIVEAILDLLDEISCQIIPLWVPSCLNIADFPSRGESLIDLLPQSVEVQATKSVDSIYEVFK